MYTKYIFKINTNIPALLKQKEKKIWPGWLTLVSILQKIDCYHNHAKNTHKHKITKYNAKVKY